jgi:hypothetical protein
MDMNALKMVYFTFIRHYKVSMAADAELFYTIHIQENNQHNINYNFKIYLFWKTIRAKGKTEMAVHSSLVEQSSSMKV